MQDSAQGVLANQAIYNALAEAAKLHKDDGLDAAAAGMQVLLGKAVGGLHADLQATILERIEQEIAGIDHVLGSPEDV